MEVEDRNMMDFINSTLELACNPESSTKLLWIKIYNHSKDQEIASISINKRFYCISAERKIENNPYLSNLFSFNISNDDGTGTYNEIKLISSISNNGSEIRLCLHVKDLKKFDKLIIRSSSYINKIDKVSIYMSSPNNEIINIAEREGIIYSHVFQLNWPWN